MVDYDDPIYPAIFQDVPPVHSVDGHLGYGVFMTDLFVNAQAVSYAADAVDVDLFQAAAGDANGDRLVDFNDIKQMLAAGKWNLTMEQLLADPTLGPAVWTDFDFTDDQLVNFDDVKAMLAAGFWNTGVYWPGSGGGAAAAQGGAGPLVAGAVDEVLFFDPADGKPGLIVTRESLTIVDNLQLAAEELGWLDEFEQMIAQQRSTEAENTQEGAIDPLLI